MKKTKRMKTQAMKNRSNRMTYLNHLMVVDRVDPQTLRMEVEEMTQMTQAKVVEVVGMIVHDAPTSGGIEERRNEQEEEDEAVAVPLVVVHQAHLRAHQVHLVHQVLDRDQDQEVDQEGDK